MLTALIVVVSVIVGLALLTCAGFLAARYYFVPRYPDEIHFARTSDDWRVALVRYRPEAPLPGVDPVVLVHGIGANRYNFDLTDDRSLARYLAASGYDVWLVELRGRGYSQRPRLFSGVRYDWCFDEYAERDLPAACAAVLRATAARRVHLVGFSTGALACYAFLSDTHRQVEVASLASLAGATHFKRTGAAVSGRLVRNLRWLRHRFLLRVLAPVSGYFHLSPLRVAFNTENVEGRIQRRAMVNLIANFARDELLQYGDWLLHDAFRSLDQRRDYRAELARIEVPALFITGGRDLLSPPDAVKDTHDAVSSPEKRFVICSRAQKFTSNYGHFDLLLGHKAPVDVYPLLRGWLDERSGVERHRESTPTTPFMPDTAPANSAQPAA